MILHDQCPARQNAESALIMSQICASFVDQSSLLQKSQHSGCWQPFVRCSNAPSGGKNPVHLRGQGKTVDECSAVCLAHVGFLTCRAGKRSLCRTLHDASQLMCFRPGAHNRRSISSETVGESFWGQGQSVLEESNKRRWGKEKNICARGTLASMK